MFNIGGGEMLVILLLALIVLGPQRLPDTARQIGKFMGELRRMSTGFQQELRSAMDDPLEAAARERGAKAAAKRPSTQPTPTTTANHGPTVEPAPAEAVDAPAPAPAKKAAAKKAPAKKQAAAKKAPARKRAAPLRAPAKPDDPAAS